jgi:hypothetical protein
LQKAKKMTTIQINEKTKIGKNILEMLKALAKIENNNSIKILDETEYLLSTKANSEALMHGIKQVQEGKKGRTIKTSDLWK